jgi:hypothetical protein
MLVPPRARWPLEKYIRYKIQNATVGNTYITYDFPELLVVT